MQLKKRFPDLRKGEEIENSRQSKCCTDRDSKGFFCSKKSEKSSKSDHTDDIEHRRYVNMCVSVVMRVWEIGRI